MQPLTIKSGRDRIIPHAGMVELVDSVDLGAVTSVKVFRPAVVANQCEHWCGNPFLKNGHRLFL